MKDITYYRLVLASFLSLVLISLTKSLKAYLRSLMVLMALTLGSCIITRLASSHFQEAVTPASRKAS